MKSNDVKITKYPVVLVHGMMAKDFVFWRAFRGIRKELERQGVKVYVACHDGIGSIEDNATQLKEEIKNLLAAEGCEKVNVIAHSKGGLDTRYMISKLNMGDSVASLTTLSTPHYGSAMSRKIMRMPSFFAKIICFFVNAFYKIFGDKNPDLYEVARQLCDTEMIDFNTEILDDDRVYYQSYSSSLHKKRTFIMYIPYRFSKFCEGEETDGIVSVSSAKWGNYRGEIEFSANHMQMVGLYYGGKKRKAAVYAFYLNIIKELAEKGF